MKLSFIFLLAGLLIFSLFFFQKKEESNFFSDSAVITLTDRGFEPEYLKVQLGTKILFTNTSGKPFWPASNSHPDHSLYSEFDPMGPLAPTESWEFVFTKVGRHPFHDHVRSYFEGVVEVVK